MIEKSPLLSACLLSEFLDLNHTRKHELASVPSIAKLVQCLPRGSTSCAIGTLERFPCTIGVAELGKRRREPLLSRRLPNRSGP